MKELTQIPFHDTTIYTTADGAYVALRPVCEALGLNFSGQQQRLQRQSWAVVCMTHTTGADGKTYEMMLIDRRTFTMWLATIDTSRVKNERTRELVRTYQCEAADALDKYFNEGIAVNPRAVEVPTPSTEDRALTRARQLVEIHMLAQGAVSPDHLEAKIRIILAQARGEHPEIEASARPLYVQDYMREKGVSSKNVKNYASAFGKRIKKTYAAEHDGKDPDVYLQETPSGQVREVCAYTEADRPLLDRIWNEHYAEKLGGDKE